MTKEDKELLLKDLSARLPYGVKIELMPITRGKCTTLTPIILQDYFISDDVNYLPYLCPMSSMTDEEKKEFELFGWMVDELADNEPWAHCGDIYHIMDGIDWLLKHHFDINHLIEKGLALEAPDGMYDLKKK